MIVAKIQVSGAIARTLYRKVIPAGIIGAQVEFEYDEDVWKGLHKTVVFHGPVTKDVVTDENIVTIPKEVAEKPRSLLIVGVYGVDAEGNLAIPTVWADLGIVRESANPSGDPTTDPSLPVWAQIQGMIGNLDELDTEAKNNLVTAVNETFTNLSEVVNQIKDDLADVVTNTSVYDDGLFTVKNAYVPIGTGNDTTSDTRICTNEYIQAKKGTVISVDSGYKFRVAVYSEANKASYIKSNTSDYVTDPYTLDIDGFIRVTVGKTDNSNIALNEAACLHIKLLQTAQENNDRLTAKVDGFADKIVVPFADPASFDVVNKFIYTTGGMSSDVSQTRIATVNYIPVSVGDTVRYKAGYKGRIAQYSSADVSTFIKNNTADYASLDWVSDFNGFIRMTVANVSDSDISVSEISNVEFLSAKNVGAEHFHLKNTVDEFICTETYNAFHDFENGSITSFSVGDSIKKSTDATYLKTRKRSVSAQNYRYPVRITCASGYQIRVISEANGKIGAITSAYASEFDGNAGSYYYIVKAVDDADVSAVDVNSVVTIKTGKGLLTDWFNRPNVYWRTPYFGSEYSIKTAVDPVTFNQNTIPETVLNAWNVLCSSNSGYLTYSVMGKDQSDTFDIAKVSAVPNGYNSANRGTSKPKVILFAGVHGNEKESVFALYYLFKDICEHWKENKVLEYLRWNVIFEIVPLANPWGFANGSNRNVRGVNINHNFDDIDNAIGYGQDQDLPGQEGEYPFSEKETQYLKSVIDDNKDAVVYFDFHTFVESTRYTYHDFDPMYKSSEYNMPMANAAINHIDYIRRHWEDDYTHDTLDPAKVYSGIVYNTLGGHAYSYAMSLGVYGHVIECGGTLPGTTVIYSEDNLRMAVQTFGQWLQIALETIYKLVEH